MKTLLLACGCVMVGVMPAMAEDENPAMFSDFPQGQAPAGGDGASSNAYDTVGSSNCDYGGPDCAQTLPEPVAVEEDVATDEPAVQDVDAAEDDSADSED